MGWGWSLRLPPFFPLSFCKKNKKIGIDEIKTGDILYIRIESKNEEKKENKSSKKALDDIRRADIITTSKTKNTRRKTK